MLEVYPPMAVRARQFAGDVVIACSVAKDGSLADCSVQEELPVKRGFGSAALKLAKKFKLATTTNDGHATAGGKILIPINFRWPQ
jgi:TonB family protein